MNTRPKHREALREATDFPAYVFLSLPNSGFEKERLEIIYTTVGNTAILSWRLNFRKIKWKEGFTGKLNWEPQGNTAIHELLNFSVTTHQELHKTKKSNHIWFEISEGKTDGTMDVKIPKVQLNHSGQYKCQLEINGRRTESVRALVVMQGERKGSADEELQKPQGHHKSMHGPIFPSSHSCDIFLSFQSLLSLLGHSPEGAR